MNTMILCEGKSDAILLSYYLVSTQNWRFAKKGPVAVPLLAGQAKSNGNWYQRDICIWGVGGKDRFGEAIREITQLNQLGNPEQAFTKLVILTDRGTAESDREKLVELETVFMEEEMFVDLQNNEWITTSYTNSFGDETELEVLTLIIPFEKHGALETFLLDALSEDADDKNVVDACRDFVACIESVKYLTKPRLKLKAELGTTLAIISPEKVFTEINETLKSIKWEGYKQIQTCFHKLDQI